VKVFLKKLFVLFAIFLTISFIAILLPATPKASKSLLFAIKDKDKLLQEVKKNRIIFIGGSNLSFGLNSQLIRDSLQLNPINTSIHAGIGLNFMLDYYSPLIDSNDIIVLVPEYAQYMGNTWNGEDVLLRLILDVDKSNINKLNYLQFKNIIQYFPKYVISKFNPKEYFCLTTKEKPIYNRSSFNEYGDAVAHWGDSLKPFKNEDLHSSSLNLDVYKSMQEFKRIVELKNAKLFVSFPCYDPVSFQKNLNQINSIKAKLKHDNFSLLGNPSIFSFKQQYYYNSPYHLTHQGANKRTLLLIKLIKQKMRR
jgi:hypothetical protein